MDPDALLRRIRANRQVLLNPLVELTAERRKEVSNQLAQDFDELDNWLIRGGFMPASWSRATDSPQGRLL